MGAGGAAHWAGLGLGLGAGGWGLWDGQFPALSGLLNSSTRWEALAEIYTMHSFAPFFNLKISARESGRF